MKRFISLTSILVMTLLIYVTGYAEGIMYPHAEVETQLTTNEGMQESASRRVWRTVYGEALRSDMEYGELRYTVYLPEKYDSKKEYPFLLYLHGGSMGYCRGDKTPWEKDLDGSWQYAESIANSIEDCIIFAPQAPGAPKGVSDNAGAYWSKLPTGMVGTATTDNSESSPYLKAVEKMMADFLEKGITWGENVYTVDAERLYVAGHSMGGIGTYTILRDCPDVFAAAIIGAGIGDPDTVERWKDTPVRIFHGTSDLTITYKATEVMAEALKDHPDAEIIALENEGHNIKPYMYGVIEKGEAGETLMWMAKQDRDKTKNAQIITFISSVVFVIAAGIASSWIIKKRKVIKQ